MYNFKINSFQNAAQIIKDKIIKTPLVYSPTFSKLSGSDVYLKLENLQKTGSFKVRGAMYKIIKNFDKIGTQGVVTASAGNHAQGVAMAAKSSGLPSLIIMPEWASISKQEATRNYGGEVIIYGHTLEISIKKAKEIAKQGSMYIPPFDDNDIIIGQGTIGLEILEDIESVDMIIVPVGGGGLISGIASVVKSINPKIKVIGVQASVCPSAYKAIQKGKVVKVKSEPSIADGISVKQTGNLNFKILEKYVDEIVLVQEDQIAAAMLMLLERKKTLAEGAGAVSLAALLNNSISIPKDSKVVLLISGGNVDSILLGRIINRGLLKNGRFMKIRVRLIDAPGSLVKLLTLIAKLKANIFSISHDRNYNNLPINFAYVDIEIETRGQMDVDNILKQLKEKGYDIELRHKF